MAQNNDTDDSVFFKVTRISNWGYWDEIDGKPIVEGNYLVKWRDGTITEEQVRVERGTRTIKDMGHDANIRDEFAYVEASVHGEQVKVRIVGLEISPTEPSSD